MQWGRHASCITYSGKENVNEDEAEEDEYDVEKILGDRLRADGTPGREFKVRWKGYGPGRTVGSLKKILLSGSTMFSHAMSKIKA